MDDEDTDQILYQTPLLTSYNSDTNTTVYYDFDSPLHNDDIYNQILNSSDNKEQNKRCEPKINDNENESDLQDKQPTEAADTTIYKCKQNKSNLNHAEDCESTKTHHANKLSEVEQKIHTLNDGVTTVKSDVQSTIEEHHERPVFNYSRSLCVPYTDEQGNLTLATTNNEETVICSLEFTGTEIKEKLNYGHIMISYNHSTKLLSTDIAKRLRENYYKVWIDQDNISGDILVSMASAIENSSVVLMAINEKYFQSRYCRLEAEYAIERGVPVIPMLMQESYKPEGWLGLIIGSKLFVDFCQLSFDEAFNLLVREVEAARASSNAEYDPQNIPAPLRDGMTTTMNLCVDYLGDVSEWSEDDVIEWLNREKLIVYKEALTNFTGATLWQLYKIKKDSPTDYYRLVETLLPSTYPLRLVYNLSFHGALDSLFSSSSNTIYR